jgi:hypothetical protein
MFHMKHHPQVYELHSNEKQNYLEPRLEFLEKLLTSFITLQFSVPELCADSSDTISPSSIRQKIIAKV